MKIAIGADHAGYKLKEKIKLLLTKEEINYQDLGAYNENHADDYPDWGMKVAEAVAQGKYGRGILICGTGIGMCLVANKVPGIRATPCYSLTAARLSREHNDSNILVLGSRIISVQLAKMIVKEWLKAKFKGGRHQRRLEKIRKIEKKYFQRR